MVMENPGFGTSRQAPWNTAIEALLIWFDDFFPVLLEHAKYLEISSQALLDLSLARELFLGSLCPCHLFYNPLAIPDISTIYSQFELHIRNMIDQIDRHPAMTNELRQRLGIQRFHRTKQF